MNLAGSAIAVFGRLRSLPRSRISGELAKQGAVLTRRLGRAQGLVVGYGAHDRLEPLGTVLGEAERRGVWCLSEGGLLRAVGIGKIVPTLRPLDAEALARYSGLDRQVLRFLALFDIIDERDGAFQFRDLVAARQVKRLIDGGTGLADIITALVAAPHRAGTLLSGGRLTRLADGEFALVVGDYLAELDGQMRLPLDEGGNPSLDDLFERAVLAEEEGRWAEAEGGYRRVLALAPRDTVAHFNLANVLGAQGRVDDAEDRLRHAVALRPGFAEAWYNLAHLLETKGEGEAARRSLERAVSLDADFADAVYNLARLSLIAGDAATAVRLYEHYLELDPSSLWADRARRCLRLARMLHKAEHRPGRDEEF